MVSWLAATPLGGFGSAFSIPVTAACVPCCTVCAASIDNSWQACTNRMFRITNWTCVLPCKQNPLESSRDKSCYEKTPCQGYKCQITATSCSHLRCLCSHGCCWGCGLRSSSLLQQLQRGGLLRRTWLQRGQLCSLLRSCPARQRQLITPYLSSKAKLLDDFRCT